MRKEKLPVFPWHGSIIKGETAIILSIGLITAMSFRDIL